MTFYGAKKLKIWLHCYGYSYEQILPTARQPSIFLAFASQVVAINNQQGVYSAAKRTVPFLLIFVLVVIFHLLFFFFLKKKFKELRPERVRLRFAWSIRFFVQNKFWSLKNYFKKRFWLIRSDCTVRFKFQNHISIILIRYTILWARRLLGFFLSLFFVSSSSF